MALPLPEPTQPHYDAVFEQLKADVLVGLQDIKQGRTVSDEEMCQIFGLEAEEPRA